MEALMKMIVAYMQLQQKYNIDRTHPFCAENRKDIEQILSSPLDSSINEIMLHYDQLNITKQVQEKIEEIAIPPAEFKGLSIQECYQMVLYTKEPKKQALLALKYKKYKQRYAIAKQNIAKDYPELVSFTTFTTDQFKNELLKLLK